MYGTVFTLKVRPERAGELAEIFAEWERELRPKVSGAVGSLAYKLDADPNTWIGCAVFSDKQSYLANAESPEQDKWYQRMRECLTADPEWNDGELISNTFPH